MTSLIKSRPDIRSTVQQMSARKSVARPRFVAARAEDNSPTPERMAKADYEQKGKERVRANPLETLYRSGEVGNDAYTAAGWWISDYVYAWHGTPKAIPGSVPDEYERGNIHTYAISRGKAAQRLGMIQDRLGHIAHERLEMVLVRELSFSAMGEALYPHLSKTVARGKMSAQCAIVLEQLPAAYADVRRELKERAEREYQKNVAGACAQ